MPSFLSGLVLTGAAHENSDWDCYVLIDDGSRRFAQHRLKRLPNRLSLHSTTIRLRRVPPTPSLGDAFVEQLHSWNRGRRLSSITGTL